MCKRKHFKLVLCFIGILFFSSTFSVNNPVNAASQKTSTSVYQAKAVKVSSKTYKGINDLKYPQVSGLKSKAFEEKINKTLLDSIKKSYKEYLELEEFKEDFIGGDPYGPGREDLYHKTTYSVKFNDGKILSILFTTDSFAAGARNHIYIKSYNFNISSGKPINLDTIFSTNAKKQKLVNLFKSYNKKHKKFTSNFSYKDIKSSSQLVYTKAGVALHFHEYTAGFSSDMPVINVPKSVYK